MGTKLEAFTSFFSNLKTKLSSLTTIQKGITSAIIIVILLGGAGTGLYFWGYKNGLEQAKLDAITPIELAIALTPLGYFNWTDQATSVVKDCGKVKLTVGLYKDSKTKIEAKAFNKCFEAAEYYTITPHCAYTNHSLGIGPSFMLIYDNDLKKLHWLIGGALEYTHWWGNFGFGPELEMFGALNKTMFAAKLNAKLNYRW
jgi:hypothetical protein